jgi:hypothetical protein
MYDLTTEEEAELNEILGRGAEPGFSTFEEAKKLIEYVNKRFNTDYVLTADTEKSMPIVNNVRLKDFGKAWVTNSSHPQSRTLMASVREVLGLKNTFDLAEKDQPIAIPEEYTESRRRVRNALVRAQYEYTQKKLKELGVKKVFVYRGMGLENADKIKSPTAISVDSRPLAAWSVSRNVADSFAMFYNDAFSSVVIRKEIPVEEVFSVGSTGIGQDAYPSGTNEREVLVLGGRSEVEAINAAEIEKIEKDIGGTKVFSPASSDEDLPDPSPSSIVSDRDKNIQEAIDDKGILTLRDVRDSAREDFVGFNYTVQNISPISLGLGQSQERSDEFMRRLWDLNSEYLDESLAVVDWKVHTQTKNKMLAMGLSDRAATRAAEGASLAAVAYAKLKNHATAMKEIASVMADEFPEDKWFGGYYKRAMVTREEVKKALIDGVPVIAADFDAALGIIGDKRFKTQWETRTSNGLYQPSTREKREYGLLAIDPKTPKGKRPIYGFLANKDSGTSPMTKPYNSDVFSANSRGASQYGDVRFVLKPETRDRTTFTMLDSLDVRSLPQPLSDNPTDEQLDMAGFWQNVTDSHDGFIRESYVETQVLGGVSMDDVQKIVVAVPDYLGVEAYEEKVNALRAALDAGGYSSIEVVPLVETVSEDYDDSLNTSGIPL